MKKIPKQYLPKSLTAEDRKKQKESIVKKKPIPKVDSFKSHRSSYVIRFEKKYGTKITNDEFINKNIITRTGIKKILDKGMSAYYNTGSRPNQTAQSWSRARLASVIVGGPARRVDNNIWEEYKR